MKFRRKSEIVEAIQFNGENSKECFNLSGGIREYKHLPTKNLIFEFKGLKVLIAINDWICKFPNEEIKIYRESEFKETFEKIPISYSRKYDLKDKVYFLVYDDGLYFPKVGKIVGIDEYFEDDIFLQTKYKVMSENNIKGFFEAKDFFDSKRELLIQLAKEVKEDAKQKFSEIKRKVKELE